MCSSASPPLQSSDDQTLVELALGGDARAFDLLVERHFDTVSMIAYARVHEREVAEDLAQEVFLRAFLSLAKLKRPDRFRAWVNQIARNLSSNWLRDNRRSSDLVKMVSLDELPGDLPDRDARGARETMESQQTETALRGAMSDLPMDLREVILLHFVQDLSQSEIARRLDVQPSTVMRRLRRAAEMMRGTLEPLMPEVQSSIRPRRAALSRTLVLVAAVRALPTEARAALEANAGDLASISAESILDPKADGGSAAASDAEVSQSGILSHGGRSISKGLIKGGVFTTAAILLSGLLLTVIPGGDRHPTEIVNSLGMRLRLIPAGSFEMGSPATEEHHTDEEGPIHTVQIDAHYMGVHEVTVENYQRFIEATGHSPPPYWETHQIIRPRLPVLYLGWDDAVAFCDWLSRVDEGVYSLPTEAQWEYACRAGSTSPYHTGESLASDQANFDPGGGATNENPPVDVGQFPPNAWGLCDMHGNAFEWCKDEWFPNHVGAPSDGSARATGDISVEHVTRGGSFWSFPHNCRSAYRSHCGHPQGHYHFGFRVVRSLD